MSLMESEVGLASEDRAVIVFFSYADKDKPLRDRLEEHLSILKYRKLITAWYDRDITAGDDWEREIYRQLEQASIVLLLISPSFMASPYCYSVEMEYALRRHERGEAQVLPVLLRPVLITGAPFAKLHVLPTNGKPVVTWRNRDSAFVEVAIEIEHIVEKRLAREVHLTVAVAASPATAQEPFPPPPPVSPIISPTPIHPPVSPIQPQQDTIATTRSAYNVPPSPHVPLSRNAPYSVGRSLLSSWSSIILVALGVIVLLSGGFFLVQTQRSNPSSGPVLTQPLSLLLIVGGIFGGLILLIGVFLALRALVRGMRSRAAQKRERQRELERQEQQRQEQREAARRRERQRELERGEQQRREQREAAQKREREQALQRRYENALREYERELQLDSAKLAAHLGKGDTLVALEHYDEAVAAYAQALALDATCVPAYRGLSKALSRLGKVQEAEQATARARQLQEDQRRERQERTYYEQALAAYEQALRQNNADATAYRGKGNALIGLKRYDEALAAFKRSVSLVPRSITYVNIGNVLELLGRHNESLAAYQQALALDATSADAYAGMSKVFEQLGRAQEAEQAAEKAKQLGYDN